MIWRQWSISKGLSYLGIISRTGNNGGFTEAGGFHMLGVTSGRSQHMQRCQITEKGKAMVLKTSTSLRSFSGTSLAPPGNMDFSSFVTK